MLMAEFYNGWELFGEMPEGWKIDKTAGSPLNGYEFITNGKSVISGQKRALLKIKKDDLIKPLQTDNHLKLNIVQKAEDKPKQIIDENYVKTVNDLARKKFEERLLNDIRCDLMICEIEGWNKLEYIEELKNLINSLGNYKGGYADV